MSIRKRTRVTEETGCTKREAGEALSAENGDFTRAVARINREHVSPGPSTAHDEALARELQAALDPTAHDHEIAQRLAAEEATISDNSPAGSAPQSTFKPHTPSTTDIVEHVPPIGHSAVREAQAPVTYILKGYASSSSSDTHTCTLKYAAFGMDAIKNACGYRNIQNMSLAMANVGGPACLRALSEAGLVVEHREPGGRSLATGESVGRVTLHAASIDTLQHLIENAWRAGFDPDQLGQDGSRTALENGGH